MQNKELKGCIIAIRELRMPQRWKDEYLLEDLSDECKTLAIKVLKHVYQKFGKLPNVIDASVESAVYFSYKSLNGFSFVVEVDNDLNVGYLLNDDLNKRIILSGDFDGR
jgi:hypothetical protein